jgi:hypothetical protein
MTPHRPIGITILSVLAGAAAVIAAIHTLQYLSILPFVLGPLRFFGFDLLAALLWACTTFVWVWVATQLWNVNPKGWGFVVLIATFNLILAFLSSLGGTPFSAIMPAVVVNAAALIYCLTPGVKDAFGQVPA